MSDISPRPLRIIALEAQNIKRIRTVEIAPRSNVIRVSGKNGSGKTSTLDSILWVLGGAREIQMKPVRKGEERGIIRAAIGTDQIEFIVTRTFKQIGDAKYTTSLSIETAKGALIDKPQRFLEDLFGPLSLDPQEFQLMKPADQMNQLRRIVKLEVDLDELEAMNKADFDRRTDVNRDLDRFKKEVELYAGGVNKSMDVAPVDTAPMFAKMAEASEFNSSIAQEDFNRNNTRALLTRAVASVKQFDAEIDALMARRKVAQEESEQLAATIGGWKPLAAPIDVTELAETIKRAQQDNSAKEIQRRARERYTAAVAQFESTKKKADELTATIDYRKARKEEAMTNAKFPVEGLAFGAEGVLFNGQPFEQASGAEQLRVSFAIAAVMKPRLPVVLIRNGAFMDDDSMILLEELADKYGAQVWIERVGAGNIGVVLEDGAVIAVDGEPVSG